MTWHRPAGSLALDRDPVRLGPDQAGWDYSGLQVVELTAGEERALTAEGETVLVPLRGTFLVESPGFTARLAGRETVFGELTDRAYVPPTTGIKVVSPSGGRLAVATARVEFGGEACYIPAAETTVELRGAGQASRQVNGLFDASVDGPEKLIVVEVLTPSGNWSSYPPHKHDEFGEDEVPLEEIYYFQIQGDRGFGFHRTYTADQSFDETVTVRDGDVYLIPRGFHGPCVAAPGYDMYYLNVMAGPERAWLICNDPAHEWVVGEWESTPLDPRLPLTREERK